MEGGRQAGYVVVVVNIVGSEPTDQRRRRAGYVLYLYRSRVPTYLR